MTEWEEKVLEETFTPEVWQLPDDTDIISNLQMAEQAGNLYIFGDKENKTVWLIEPNNMTRCSLHTCTDNATGMQLVKSLRKVVDWIWEDTMFLKIEGRFTDERECALMKRIGATHEGTCRNSFIKGDKLVDEYIYGLYRGEG